jgi:hypothetical protein
MTTKTHSSLADVARAVGVDMASGGSSRASQAAMRSMEGSPEIAFDLVELIGKEGARKRPRAELIQGYVVLLATSLERMRHGVEQGQAAAIDRAARLRKHVQDLAEAGRIAAPQLHLVLAQFAAAKLEMGDALRDAMQRLMQKEMGSTAAADVDAIGNEMANLARQLGGDPFAMHGVLDESVEAAPEDLRAKVAVAAFDQRETAVHEAALGFLLNGSRLARAALAEAVALAAARGLVTPTMLRRLIAMRSWLPAADQPAVDAAIGACRKAGIDCATWPETTALQILASGVDGSGAQTVLVVAGTGRKCLLSGLLLKHGIGVRDAWVRRGVTKAEVREIVSDVGGEIALAPTSPDYVALATRHFLAVNGRSGVMPPFGLLDFAETVGLADLNPAELPVEILVATLCDAIDPALLTDAAVGATLRDSVGWADKYPIVETWFVDNVGKSLGKNPAAGAKQTAMLLAGPLQSRRRYWAEMAAWTALGLEHRPGSEAWQGFAIVARELLGQRPLDEIGIMKTVAQTSLAVMSMHRLLGVSHAA